MARTYRTLSLSLHPDVVADLERRGRHTNITAARVAANLVLCALAKAEYEPVAAVSPAMRRARVAITALLEISRDLNVELRDLVSLHQRVRDVGCVRTIVSEALQVARALDVDVTHVLALHQVAPSR